ncbi:MAG: membrane protein insertase YidC [Fibrobacter sp.]|jgi:YidC/Oxa1 family membrane protein insertase|nr:membrane protein insertase YidC [Fibrobacter sp.]
MFVFNDFLNLCYVLTENFGGAIILFAILIKVVLFPISLISQKNSLILYKLQPQLEDIKARYAGEPRELLREQRTLYKKENYSTLKAILPLLLQIPVLIGVIKAVNNAANNDSYRFLFMGINLSIVPSLSNGVIIPLLSAVSAFLLCFTQNMLNPLTKSQGFAGKWGTTIFLTAFGGYFAFVCQAGVGLYWIFGNLFGIVVCFLCYLIYNPKKYVDYINRSVKPKLTKEEKRAIKESKRLGKLREKEDMKRFFSCEKRLVFYSESSGFYKYFAHYIEYILKHSDIVIHYLTSDLNDQVFKINHPRFKAYFCSANGMITTFMKMDADVVVLTMPDLEQYHYKRSLVKKDIEYIYLPHGIGGFNILLRKGALDHFDTLFCYGCYYNEEAIATEEFYNLPRKQLVNTGYGMLVSMIENYKSMEKIKNPKPQILVAPSWQKDNIFELCLNELLSELICDEYKVIIRPHPEFAKRFPGKMKQIFDKYGDKIGENFEIQTDFSSNSTVYSSDLVITDWSAISYEFSFSTKKPTLFINTPMKVMNLEWNKIDIEHIDIWIRDKIGESIDVDKLGGIREIVTNLLESRDTYKESIERVMREKLYAPECSARIGGEYIISRIREKYNET